MSRFVLDASALLAFLNVEPGAERVADILLDGQVVLLSVNLTETLGKLADWAVPLDAAAARIEVLKMTGLLQETATVGIRSLPPQLPDEWREAGGANMNPRGKEYPPGGVYAYRLFSGDTGLALGAFPVYGSSALLRKVRSFLATAISVNPQCKSLSHKLKSRG